jgi:hypothetical protein
MKVRLDEVTGFDPQHLHQLDQRSERYPHISTRGIRKPLPQVFWSRQTSGQICLSSALGDSEMEHSQT